MSCTKVWIINQNIQLQFFYGVFNVNVISTGSGRVFERISKRILIINYINLERKIIYFMEEQENLVQFGLKIKELRKKKNFTQAKLAEKLDVSPNFIGMIERAERNTIVATIFKLARILDVEPIEFLKFKFYK